MSINHPVAIVTGAGSGIGRATALALARSGYELVLAGRTERPLRETAEQAEGASAAGSRVPAVVSTDMADPGQVRRLVDETLAHFGRIDALINNAGTAAQRPIGESDPEFIQRMFEVNAIGPACAISAVWPVFERQKRGCIVNVSSMATYDPYPGFFAYAASKGGVNLMARSCAKEGAAIGVRAFTVAPAAVETPMLRGMFSAEALPADRCLSPDRVAALIVACVKGERDARNGDTIFINAEKGEFPRA